MHKCKHIWSNPDVCVCCCKFCASGFGMWLWQRTSAKNVSEKGIQTNNKKKRVLNWTNIFLGNLVYCNWGLRCWRLPPGLGFAWGGAVLVEKVKAHDFNIQWQLVSLIFLQQFRSCAHCSECCDFSTFINSL